ncbi:YfjI family protein [Ralstonia soli]|uniref:YfjI family protein n=1 Tax=Ralstonia soli TaxID=2953896 RepID=A0ABT1ANA3_9RALS|nr:YfjI family protein [Ralstonia soli]MCO5399754.1 YfjI family protein [Ralstonia soli]
MDPLTTLQQPYPLNAFHLVIKEAAEEVVRHVQAPDALVGMEFLTNMSASAQGLYDVRLPTGQIRPLSLNLLTVADSGERKTGVHDLVAAPLYEFDQERIRRHEADFAQYELDMRVWEQIDKGLRRRLTKLTQEDKPIEETCLQLSEQAAAKPVMPRPRRIMHQNATERAIMDALEGDGESIAFISDEGDVIIKGGALKQLGVLNKAWDGAQMLTMDRSNGVSIVVRNPRVTVSYQVQPAVLKELLDRRGDVMRGSGHWARYLVGCPTSTQGIRFTYRLTNEWRHLPRFHECMRDVLNERGRRIDAGVMERTTLEFMEDASSRWIVLGNELESALGLDGDLHDIKDHASKALEITGRVAALLHVFSMQEGAISVDTLNRAVSIVGWHIDEFRRIFSPEYAVPQEQADAQVLERYLRKRYARWNRWVVEKNKVLRNGPVRPVSRLDAALDCLNAAGAVWVGVGLRNEQYINLNQAYFGSQTTMGF